MEFGDGVKALYLFIFESIGTSELLLIGIVALIFLGPRRLPEIARKLGKIMAEFRTTTNEFKATWEREVDFEEEAKALRLSALEAEAERPIARENAGSGKTGAAPPEIRPIDPSEFEAARPGEPDGTIEPAEDLRDAEADKRNWV